PTDSGRPTKSFNARSICYAMNYSRAHTANLRDRSTCEARSARVSWPNWLCRRNHSTSMLITEAIKKVVEREDLTSEEAEAVLDQIMTGQCTDAQIASL